MKTPAHIVKPGAQRPILESRAEELAAYLKTLSTSEIQKAMVLSESMAVKTHKLLQEWDPKAPTLPCIDIFLGDIYSGLQVKSFTNEDRAYANNTCLYILSGLYGVLRPLDEIQPYRLEMGYKLPGKNGLSHANSTSLYMYWGDEIARQLPARQAVINLSAVEYTKAIFPHFKNSDELKDVPIITPKFLTINPKTREAVFVTVHTKIARGAFARWLIQHRIEDRKKLREFNDLGYEYSIELSSDDMPVFIAQEFKGSGLSVRLDK